jgi:hypothetical protein
MLQFIFLGTVFEVLKVLTIYHAVWVRTPYSLVHGLKLPEDHSRRIFTSSQKTEAVCPDGNSGLPEVRLHGPTTRQTIILCNNLMHSVHCVTTIFITNQLNAVSSNKYTLLFYIIFLSEHICRKTCSVK